jgi:hypothetical protein
MENSRRLRFVLKALQARWEARAAADERCGHALILLGKTAAQPAAARPPGTPLLQRLWFALRFAVDARGRALAAHAAHTAALAVRARSAKRELKNEIAMLSDQQRRTVGEVRAASTALLRAHARVGQAEEALAGSERAFTAARAAAGGVAQQLRGAVRRAEAALLSARDAVEEARQLVVERTANVHTAQAKHAQVTAQMLRIMEISYAEMVGLSAALVRDNAAGLAALGARLLDAGERAVLEFAPSVPFT